MQKKSNFEKIALAFCGIMFITLFIFKLVSFRPALPIISSLTLGTIVALLIYYAKTAKNRPIALTIILSSIIFLGIFMQNLNLPGGTLLIMAGTILIALSPSILSILILKNYSASHSDIKQNLIILKVLTIYLIADLVFVSILKLLPINVTYLCYLPIIFMVSYLISNKAFSYYAISIKNGLKSLLLVHFTLFSFHLITKISESLTKQQIQNTIEAAQ